MEQSSELELVIMALAGILIFTVIIAFIISFIIMYRKKQIAHQHEKLALQQKFEKEILQSQLETYEQTLKNISQEIHDNIGQTLTLAKLQLNRSEESASPGVTSGKDLITKAISDLRTLSRSLNGNFLLDLGLQGAIVRELKLTEETGKIETFFDPSEFNDQMLDPNQQIILFRCFQECLNNTLKHAGAGKVSVNFKNEGESFVLIFGDNGIGINKEKISLGLGLKSIKERMELLNGSFQINSKEEGGTEIKLSLPFTEKVI